MNKETMQSIGFQIISFAGSAFDHFNRAIEHASNGLFEESDNEIKLGNDDLNQAHQAQTNLLIAEVNQEELEFSLIMVHAQDHLTMAIFTQRIAKQMIVLWKEVLRGK